MNSIPLSERRNKKKDKHKENKKYPYKRLGASRCMYQGSDKLPN